MIGIVFNTIIPIIVFPYVTRVLGVAGIGKYSFYSSALTYVALFTGFGIALYGTREIGKCADNIQKRTQKLVELMIINLVMVAIFYLFVVYISFFTSYSNDRLIIILFSLTLFTNALGAEWFFVGIEKQGYMLVRNVVIKTFSTIMILLLVKEPEHLVRYVAITVFSMAGTSLSNIYILIKLLDFNSVTKLNLCKYIKPLSSIFSIEVLLRFLGLGDIVILGVLAGNNAVGIYSMGLKVFLLVASIMKVTATTLMPRSAYYLENNDSDGFNRLLNNTVRMLFMVGLPISACMYLFAEPVILLLGGEQFVGSISLMKEMSFFLLISVVINTYVFQGLYPQNKIKSIIGAHIAGLVANVVLNFTLVPIFSFQGTFIAFAVSNIVIAVVLIIKEYRFFRFSFFIKDYINYLYATLVAVLFALLIYVLMPSGIWRWLLMLVVFGLAYLYTLTVLKDIFYLTIFKKLIKRQ